MHFYAIQLVFGAGLDQTGKTGSAYAYQDLPSYGFILLTFFL